eukprot:gene11947-18433_t
MAGFQRPPSVLRTDMEDEVGVVPYAPIAPHTDIGEKELLYQNRTLHELTDRYTHLLTPAEFEQYSGVVLDMHQNTPSSEHAYQKQLTQLRRKHKFVPKKSKILHAYLQMVRDKRIEQNDALRKVLVTKASKSQSGVLVITVLTSPTPSVPGGKPQNFSCKWDCHYCPNQPGQPRSYLRDEPAVRRANQNQFDPVLQFADRASVLAMNGHPCDKVELLVLGGTWHSYPLDYQEAFVRDLFYAANTFQLPRRHRMSLEEEQKENEGAACKIIGLTLETRPDCINEDELRRLRRYGCTRVQIGLQHTDPGVLTLVNRGHDVNAAIEAIRLLKDSCYKLDVHLMPNLPGTNPALDEAMFERMLNDEDLQADQWKIYPCEIVPWTRIEKWYHEGKYIPYGEDLLAELIAKVKRKVHPWIRLNRIIRDIPHTYIVGGLETTNLREWILAKMRREGTRCRCIRCREVGDIGGWQAGDEQAGQGERLGNREGGAAAERGRAMSRMAELITRQYKSSGGDEYFISYEAPGEVLCGFCRLRLSERQYYPSGLFPELKGAALIRELHVYGQLISTEDSKDATNAQHIGFGTMMMAEAEDIAARNGFHKVAVIAGVGTRNYYRKLGYEVEGEGQFLMKHFKNGKKLPVPPRGRIAVRYRPLGTFVLALR